MLSTMTTTPINDIDWFQCRETYRERTEINYSSTNKIPTKAFIDSEKILSQQRINANQGTPPERIIQVYQDMENNKLPKTEIYQSYQTPYFHPQIQYRTNQYWQYHLIIR